MTVPEGPTSHWGEIDGVSIDFPMVVQDMRQATLTYSVPIEAARVLLPGDAFEVLEVSEGTAMFIVALVDYVSNPWGDYDEVNLGLLAHPVGQPERAGAFVYRMPVDQEFTMKAGNAVLGLPKTVEDLDIFCTGSIGDGEVRVELLTEWSPTMSVSLPRAAPEGPATSTETVTYSYLDGVPMELPLTIEMGSGVIDPTAVHMELGDGPLADELRTFGPSLSAGHGVLGEGLRGTFLAPRPL